MTATDRATDPAEIKPPTGIKVLYGVGHMHEGGFNTAIGFVFFYLLFMMAYSYMRE